VDIKLIFLLIFAFVFELFFLSKDLRFKDQGISVEKTDIEFVSSKTYNIDKDGISTVLICDKIQQKKTKKIFFKPIATLYDNNITKTIVANKAVLFDKSNIVVLRKDVNILYLDKQLSCDMLKYNLKKESVIDSSPFVLKSPEILAKGNHLYFDTKNSIIKAKHINYKIKLKE